MSLDAVLQRVDGPIRRILDAVVGGAELSWEDAVVLDGANGPSLVALCLAADHLRQEQVGDTVSYVVNRNINFTNVCVKACKFCAFSRKTRSEEGYFLDDEAVVERARQAWQVGATEVCVQAGLAPWMRPDHYVRLIRAIKAELPELHIHALSPEEVKYAAHLAERPIRDVLLELRDAGLGSLPGTSAEILDDELRNRIAPGRISTAEWIEVVTTAHELGLPTSSTMMFGHAETSAHRARHLGLLRSLQRRTGGFTEFVPLSFVHDEAPLFASEVDGVRPGPSGNEVIRLYAIARLMLGRDIVNLQASWVKEGLRTSQWLLSCGVNDLGGTLINESISTSAGARHGQLARPSDLRALIEEAGRVPAQRDTLYRLLPEVDAHPLDAVDDADGRFGSYDELVGDEQHRFRRPERRA